MTSATSAAEVYETDLGFYAKPDARLCYVEQFVKGLFCEWAARAQLDIDDSLPRTDDTWCIRPHTAQLSHFQQKCDQDHLITHLISDDPLVILLAPRDKEFFSASAP